MKSLDCSEIDKLEQDIISEDSESESEIENDDEDFDSLFTYERLILKIKRIKGCSTG